MSEFMSLLRRRLFSSLLRTAESIPGSFVFFALSAEEARTSFMTEPFFLDENDAFSSRNEVFTDEISLPRNFTRPAKKERTIIISVQRTAFVSKTLSIPKEIMKNTAMMQTKTDMRIILSFMQPPFSEDHRKKGLTEPVSCTAKAELSGPRPQSERDILRKFQECVCSSAFLSGH